MARIACWQIGAQTSIVPQRGTTRRGCGCVLWKDLRGSMAPLKMTQWQCPCNYLNPAIAMQIHLPCPPGMWTNSVLLPKFHIWLIFAPRPSFTTLVFGVIGFKKKQLNRVFEKGRGSIIPVAPLFCRFLLLSFLPFVAQFFFQNRKILSKKVSPFLRGKNMCDFFE